MNTDTKVKNGWITSAFRNKFHYKDDLVHREDGPAVIYNGDLEWWTNGKLHREDGPAVIRRDGIKKWYINGKEYSFEAYCKELNLSSNQIVKLTLKYSL